MASTTLSQLSSDDEVDSNSDVFGISQLPATKRVKVDAPRPFSEAAPHVLAEVR